MPAIFSRQEYRPPPGPPPTPEYLAETLLPRIFGLVGTFSGLALLAVAFRLYVRAKMLRFVGPDDYVMLAAAMMSLAVLICFCGESRLGIGRHVETWQPWQFAEYMKWSFAHGLLVMWGVVLVKISIAFFLMRIVPKKPLKIFLWCAVAFLSAFGLACTGTLVFGCKPIAAGYDLALRGKPTTKCFPPTVYAQIGLFNSIINILTDVLFALLPIPVIAKLQVNPRTKISLVFVLSLGFVACAAGIIKSKLQVHIFEDADAFFEDNFMLWNMLELNLGILAASLPSLKPLFAAVLDTTRSRFGLSNPSRPSGRSPAYPGLSAGSAGFRRHHDPNSFSREDSDEIDLRELSKSNGTTRTVIRSFSRRDVGGKGPYNARVTSGSGEEKWGGRTESKERLNQPEGGMGIMRKVEMVTTREDVR